MSDTDDHEFTVEETGKRTFRKRPPVQQVQPTRTDMEERERQQFIEDKILADAGVNLAEIESAEERRQMLEVLKLSSSPVPGQTKSVSTGLTLEGTQPFVVEGDHSENEDAEKDYVSTSDATAPPKSLQEKASTSAEAKAQQSQATGNRGKTLRRIAVRKKVENEDKTESDVIVLPAESSDAVSDPKVKPIRSSGTISDSKPNQQSQSHGAKTVRNSGAASSSRLPEKSLQPAVMLKREVRQEGSSAELDFEPSAGRPKEASSDSDVCTKSLQTRVMKRLTTCQMRNAKEVVTSMFHKVKSSQQDSQPTAEEKKEEEVLGSSQDLFREGKQAEAHSLPVQSHPSIALQQTSGGDDDACGLDTDVETLPPESPSSSQTSKGMVGDTGNDSEDDHHDMSREYLMQGTQPMMQATQPMDVSEILEKTAATTVSEASSAARQVEKRLELQKQVEKQRELHKRLERKEKSGERGDKENEDDKRPLISDGWFCWSHAQPPQPLERKYRKRKHPSEKARPYFCPSPKIDPKSYARVILQQFNLYFTRLAEFQKSLTHRIPWGKPVQVGQHRPGTLDVKRRGESVFVRVNASSPTFPSTQVSGGQNGTERVNMEDDDDDFVAEPAAKKRAVGDGGQTRMGLRLVGERTGAPMPGTSSAADEATQPYDLQLDDDDDELPDISFSQRGKSSSQPTARNEMDVDDENSTRRRSGSPVSSQSSNSRLNEEGDLYCTQFPPARTRRKVGREPLNFQSAWDDDNMVVESVSQQKQSQRSSRRSQRKDDGGDGTLREKSRQAAPNRSQPTTRKRKQDSAIDLDEVSDDEVLLPHKKKREVAKIIANQKLLEQQGKVRVIVSADQNRSIARVSEGGSTQQAVVQPTVTGLASTSKHGAQEETESRYFQGSQNAGAANTRKSPIEMTDDEDSVQFLSLTQADQGGQKGGQQQVMQQQVQTAAAEEEEAKFECPMCGKSFPQSKVDQHAWSCGNLQEEDPLPEPNAAANPFYPRGQVSRRPLHKNDREEFRCLYCDVRFMGSGALERHMGKCVLEETQKQEQIEMERDLIARQAVSRTQVGVNSTGLTSTTKAQWLVDYKIPRKSGDSSIQHAATSAPVLSEDIIEEVPSDDSDEDPSFALSKADLEQEKEDLREDGDHSQPKFKPISKMTNSKFDFKNQFPGKGRSRQPKSERS